MPFSCFDYPADVPPGSSYRNTVPSALPGPHRMGLLNCFSYPGDVPPGPRQMPTSSSCFRYPGDVPPGPRQMPGTSTCFKY
jgi:hypothetical protein